MGGSQWSGASGRGGMSYGDVEPRGFGATSEGYGGHGISHVRAHDRFRDDPRWGMSPDTDERRERGAGRGEGMMRTDRERFGVGRIDSARFEAARDGRSEASRYDGGRYDGNRYEDGRRYESGRYDRREPYGTSESANYPSFERPHQGEFQRWGNGTYGRPESRQGSPHPGYGSEGSDMGFGERGPHYGKGPKGYRRSDERIREDVCEIIARQGHIDASEVEVAVDKAIVRLSGTVATRHDKRALEQMIESVHGIDEVHNEIRLTRGRGNVVASAGRSESRLDKSEKSARESSVAAARESSRDTARDDVRGDMTTSHVAIQNGRARS